MPREKGGDPTAHAVGQGAGAPEISPRTRRRLESAELRERVLRTAVDLVAQMDSLTIGVEDLSMEQVIRQAEVPRSSAYRLWPYRGDFVDDVLVALAGSEHMSNLSFDDETIAGAEAGLAANREDLTDAQSRRALTRSLVREWALYDFKRIVTSREWQEYVALIAGTRFVRSLDARERLAVELQSRERTFIGRMATFYESMITNLGMRLRSGLDYRQLAVSLASVLEGLALRQTLVVTTQDTSRRLLVDEDHDWTLGEVMERRLDVQSDDGEQWSLPAFAFLAILEGFTEDDPDFEVPAA